MPEEKQRKKRIRVEKLDEWIEILKLIERAHNFNNEYTMVGRHGIPDSS